ANIADAKNLLAVAESGMGRINDILVQMRNKVQAGGSDTMGAEERQAISDQVTAYLAQIDDLVSQTKWNGTALIGGSSNLVFQTGADSGDSVTMTAIANLNSTGLSLSASSLDTSSSASFRTFMAAIETAMGKVNAELAKVGALTGRLSFKEDQVAAAQINVEAAYNRIMNANMAEEQVNASKYQILQQTATAMLAQANAAPQFLLSLFR
ncbi:MAG TPA: flagellin, partial [Anaerolinea thermolimosa]|nr:flagellin [Anaerolinea thermolimosa]